MLVICTDITRIKELEKEGHKMRSRFFSSAAHELRTPLNSMHPILQLALKMLESAESIDRARLTHYLNIVRSSSIHLENVVNDALDITRIENHKFEIQKDYFAIKDMVQEVCDLMRFQFDSKNLTLKVNVESSVPLKIYSDAKRLKQVLYNLIGNALKFTFKGSVSLRVSFESLSDRLSCSVLDTGVGIKKAD